MLFYQFQTIYLLWNRFSGWVLMEFYIWGKRNAYGGMVWVPEGSWLLWRDLGIDGKVLKWSLKVIGCVGMDWGWTCSVLLTLISWLAEELLDCEGTLCSVELVCLFSYFVTSGELGDLWNKMFVPCFKRIPWGLKYVGHLESKERLRIQPA